MGFVARLLFCSTITSHIVCNHCIHCLNLTATLLKGVFGQKPQTCKFIVIRETTVATRLENCVGVIIIEWNLCNKLELRRTATQKGYRSELNLEKEKQRTGQVKEMLHDDVLGLCWIMNGQVLLLMLYGVESLVEVMTGGSY